MRTTLDLGSWVILRMASADTLKVARSLTDAGLQVWTPIEKRVGRTEESRSRFPYEHALLPSYAFGRAEHIDELLRIAVHPGREHPRFSVMRYQNSIPLIADDQLAALRGIEHELDYLFRSKEKGPEFVSGDEVRMTEGAYEGLVGIVEGKRGKAFAVRLSGFDRTVEVASFLLVSENQQAIASAA